MCVCECECVYVQKREREHFLVAALPKRSREEFQFVEESLQHHTFSLTKRKIAYKTEKSFQSFVSIKQFVDNISISELLLSMSYF